MPLKLSFNSEIYRFANLPSDFKALIDLIFSTFQNKLPKSWGIHYIDSEGDNILLSNNQNYVDVLNSEFKHPSNTIKFYVTSLEEKSNSSFGNLETNVPLKHLSIKQEDEKAEDILLNDQDKHGLQGKREGQTNSLAQNLLQEAQTNVYAQKIQGAKLSPQNKRGKAAQADNMVVNDQKQYEKKSRSRPQPFDISFKELSDAELIQVLEELKAIEETFTPEQKHKFEKKRESIQRKLTKKQVRTPPEQNEEQDSQIAREKQEKINGKPFKIFKAFTMLDKIQEIAKKRETDQIIQRFERMLVKVPQEAKQALELVFQAVKEGKDKESLKKIVAEVKEKLLIIYPLQDQEKSTGQWKKPNQKKQQYEEFRERSNNGKEYQELIPERQKQTKKDYIRNFYREMREKALKMSELLPNEEASNICKFVSQSSEELSVKELIAKYQS